GDLKIAELEDAWNRKSKALLDLVPATPREGVLQDVHWASGLFGYFPTYTIGNLYAAQLTETYATSHDLAGELRRGECASLLAWLRDKVHRFGNRLPAEEIVTNATGKGLDVEAYFRHIDSPQQ